VISTDQTECKYHVNIRQTLSHKGERENNGNSNTRHNITHSYTVQYTIKALGKLLPTVFVYLQERSSAFSPLICEEEKTFSKKFGNVFITAAKSEKLQKKRHTNSFWAM
jgi:hypothetical protein